MISKAECLKLIEVNNKNSKKLVFNNNIVKAQVDAELINNILNENLSAEDTYTKLGNALSVTDSDFADINFREDCYDYLLSKGFDENGAFELMEVIRKGQYRFEKHQITSDKLTEDFYNWARGVKYLPSRKVLKEMAEEKTIYKTVIVKEFDKFYYKKLRKSMPEKINNGEIEWIYAYGDKLIARGNKSVFDVVKRIVETKEATNPYIKSEVLYKKCCELYEKYKNKKFWFSLFK